MFDTRKLGTALLKKRKECGYTMSVLAEKIDISKATISRIENYGEPDVNSLAKVLCFLDMPFDSFVLYIAKHEHPYIDIRIDKITLPKDRSKIEFVLFETEEIKQGEFIESEEMFYVSSKEFYYAFSVLKWRYLNQ